jgi:hypothetical protein
MTEELRRWRQYEIWMTWSVLRIFFQVKGAKPILQATVLSDEACDDVF